MIRYYKLKHHPGWYFKIEGANAWCIRCSPRWTCAPWWWTVNGDPFPADALIKNYELIELTKEQVFLELL